ncbi:MAG: hypothetical protein NT069_20995 [Planctomycetota bacterium]|nr:hypothetical protein [Planctomycetota bacterium]
MSRSSLSFAAGLGLLASSIGCSHMTETKVITAFHESLSKHDLDKLREQASDEFESRAVKGADTFDALELIDFPEGKIKVVKSVDTEKDDRKRPIEKKVTIEIGEEKKRVVVFLKKDPDLKRWVVVDEYLRKEDVEKGRSLSTRLELLVSVNRSLSAWRGGNRGEIGTVATPEFTQAIASLTPDHFRQLSTKLTTGIAPQARVLPNDRIGEETATTHVARSDGELVLKFRRVGRNLRTAVLPRKSGRRRSQSGAPSRRAGQHAGFRAGSERQDRRDRRPAWRRSGEDQPRADREPDNSRRAEVCRR